MTTRFKDRAKTIDIVITTLAIMLSVGIMIYGIFHYGLKETWPEMVLNMFYIACVVMIWLYFFNRLKAHQFNYWCTLCVGITILLRDILFPVPIAYYPIKIGCLTLSVLLLLMLTFFYARKDWENYTKGKLWTIFIIDTLIAVLYHINFVLEPSDEFTTYMITEIWIRPTITYGLVACFVSGTKSHSLGHSDAQ